QTSIPYENHRTFPIAFTHDIVVPGGGVVEYHFGDRNCHAVDNCGPGPHSASCTATAGRNVPSDPNLVIPTTYMGQSVASQNTRNGVSQPFHAALVHVTVTDVVAQ